MKTFHTLVGALLVGTLISGSALAAPFHSQMADFEPPSPEKIVSFRDLPRQYINTTVEVSCLVDIHGVPHDVKVVDKNDPELQRCLERCVRAWRFTPAMIVGGAVSRRVVMPLTLVIES